MSEHEESTHLLLLLMRGLSSLWFPTPVLQNDRHGQLRGCLNTRVDLLRPPRYLHDQANELLETAAPEAYRSNEASSCLAEND